MKQYTEAERAALLDEIKYNRENCFCSDKTLELFSVAESALTKPPVAALRMPDYEEDEQAFNYGLHALIDCLEDCGDAGQGLRLAIRAMRLNATAPAEEKK